jgi:hypothetical protein
LKLLRGPVVNHMEGMETTVRVMEETGITATMAIMLTMGTAATTEIVATEVTMEDAVGGKSSLLV